MVGTQLLAKVIELKRPIGVGVLFAIERKTLKM
jgi:hypothetical protein